MHRPSFQLYPGDYRSNANLSRCSWAARGAWIEILCLMHDSDRYGVIEWPLKDIAHALGCPAKLLSELANKQVLKGADKGMVSPMTYTPRHAGKDGEPVVLIPEQQGPLWYSSRMVRDEYVRQTRGSSTRFSPNDAPKEAPKGKPKSEPKPPFGDGASSSSSSSSSKEEAASAIADGVAEQPSAKSQVFAKGIELLVAQGKPESQARSILGKLCGQVGDDKALTAIIQAEREKPVDLVSWLFAAAKPRAGGVHLGAQDYAAGWGQA